MFALFFLWPVRRSDPPATGLKLKTLAVLPFKPLDAFGYLQKGMFEEAKAELAKFRQIDDSPGKRDLLMAMGALYALSGRRDEARKAFEEVKRLAENGYVDPGAMMWMHFHLGEKVQAFAWMEKAHAEQWH